MVAEPSHPGPASVTLSADMVQALHLAGIEFLVHVMDRAAGDLHAMFKSLPLGVKPGKRRQKAGMYVYYPAGKSSNEIARKQPHIAREANKFDATFAQLINDPCIMLFAAAAFPLNNDRLDPSFTGLLEPGRISFVADHHRDFRIRYLAALNGVDYRNHVRAAARNEDPKFHRPSSESVI